VNKLAEAKKVVFANEEVTIHLLLNGEPDVLQTGREVFSTESQVLLPGQFVDQNAVPPYLLNAVKEGTAPGLQLMTEARAKKISSEAAEIRAIATQTVNVQGPVSEGDAMAEAIKTASAANSDE
jgi:hypothetical protein